MHHAGLHDGQRPYRVHRVGQAFEPVADQEEHIVHAPVLQLGEHRQPIACALRGGRRPDAQHVAAALQIHANGHVERAVGDLPVAHLDDGRVDEHGRVHTIQGTRAPFVLLGHDPLGDATDGLPGHVRPVDLLEVGADLAGGQAPGIQGQHHLVHPGQPPLPFPDDDRLERAIAVSRHLDPDRTYRIGDHGLGGGAVARVRGPAVLGFLVLGAAQVLGHLLVQGRLQHAFGELFEQSVGPCQVQSFFLGHAHECERRLPLGVAFFRVRLLRRCHVSPCPSRHRPPAFPTGHTTGQLRPVTHFERQSRFQRKERKEKEGMERCHAGITQHRTWRNYRISPSGALAS